MQSIIYYFFERYFLKSHTSYTANVSGAKVYLLLLHSHFAKVKYGGGDVGLNLNLSMAPSNAFLCISEI